MTGDAVEADVCLILEGTYPFVAGGVASWAHHLIEAQHHLRFHVLALVADAGPRSFRYKLPGNVVGFTDVPLQQEEDALAEGPAIERLAVELEEPLTRLLRRGKGSDFRAVAEAVHRHRAHASRAALMNSEPMFALIERMYEASVPGSSFLNYFWSWRSLAGGVFSVLLAQLPRARVYHAISTGFAGLMLARAVTETRRPGIVTEHGIYTNERRVEIAMADWLADKVPPSLRIEKRRRDLRDIWMDAFVGYAHACYESCSRITTLYADNQDFQLRDGARPDRLAIIPNGVDSGEFGKIARERSGRRPTVALIGRVVPIKDVKTFIRAATLLRQNVPDVLVQLLGPTDEDPQYVQECRDMVAHLQLGETVEFCGAVRLQDHLGRVDVVALTSISEAQPLVLLEAGAAGIPSVATNVGCCRDLLLGRAGEDAALGPGGIVTPLANPMAIADALARLLMEPGLAQRYGSAMRLRVERYYNNAVVDQQYAALYADHLRIPEPAAAVLAA